MPLRILVIDDEPMVCMTVRMLLARLNHTVETACNGREGVQCARASKPDVIVSDSRMPVLSGQEMVAELRSESDTARIPVVIMSGHETSTSARSYAEAYVQKPFSLNDLVSAIQCALQQRFA